MSPYRAWVVTGLRFLLAAVLIWAGTAKLVGAVDRSTLYGAMIGDSAILHGAVIATELCLGLWLAVGRAVGFGALLAICLFSTFCGVLLSEAMAANPRECACFGNFGMLTGFFSSVRTGLAVAILRNVMLVIAAIIVMHHAAGKPTRLVVSITPSPAERL